MNSSVASLPPSPPPLPPSSPSPKKPTPVLAPLTTAATRRRAIALLSSSSLLHLVPHPLLLARAEEDDEEERVVRVFKPRGAQSKKQPMVPGVSGEDGEDWSEAKVQGTGSGFFWDKAGHIVTNYHVIAKLAMDRSGLQRCEVFLEDSNGNAVSKEGKLIGYDPAYDLAVLKVNVEGHKLRPALIGTSHELRVGQSCFAIGNPYGYEHTLTTGVVSGLGREIPSPNGRAISGAIQTDAAINAGNSGGPLIDSYGHVIGVNTASFTRKGSGISSGVNFAIPIDAVVQTVPYLIVYGTSVSNRF